MPGFLEFQSLRLFLGRESHLFLRLLSGAGVDANSVTVVGDGSLGLLYGTFISFAFRFQQLLVIVYVLCDCPVKK